MDLSRRGFLSGAAALGFAGVPQFLLEAAGRTTAEDSDYLVVLQLSGGNDGLNTVVPYEDDVYQRSRPSLRIDKNSVLKLSGSSQSLGLHPEMEALRTVYDDGGLSIINGVGYPNPNRSHFRSMDIWHTARLGVPDTSDGWLGRSLNDRSKGLSAVFIGDDRLPVALNGEVPVPTLQNVDFLDFLATKRGRQMRTMMDRLHQPSRTGGPEHVRRLATDTLERVETLVEMRKRPVPVEYPESRLASRLQLTGQLISGGLDNRIFYLTQGGYDTHARQGGAHSSLMRELSEGVGAFYSHMKKAGLDKRVTVLVFSEFGRRLRENGSFGTDHGVAGPVFMVSGKLRGGVVGDYPRLDDLTDGDLKHSIDFRRVYATLIQDVLGLDSKLVLGGGFKPLDVWA